MTSNIITVLALVAGIVWLGVLVVAAFRNRGGEEVAPNLQPGIDDQRLETKRLEKGQKVAILGSAFLAISLPLYFLGENNRQENFVEAFAEESIERGAHIVEEFKCFNCHGPLGVGGAAPYVETRSGVSVSWTAPSLNDVFYRYDEDEVNFWVTFGRGNTPMPAWGLAGGGPLSEKQVVDVVNYIRSIQIGQQEAVDKTPGALQTQLLRLEGADATVASTVLSQQQVLAEIEQAPGDAAAMDSLSERAKKIFDGANVGIDTDADGLSDTAEAELVAISKEAIAHFREVEPIVLDPTTPDAEKADEAVAVLETAAVKDPILNIQLAAIRAILETASDGEDTDGDGLSDQAETQITSQMVDAAAATIPASVKEVELDPTNPETDGSPDRTVASAMVGGLGSVAVTTNVAAENQDKLLEAESAGFSFLTEALERKAWEIDIEGVAASMGVDVDAATRAVALFNANCARCHTASFSAGPAFTLEAGSGGFGPALFNGRPVTQFGPAPTDPEETDLLIDFLIKGSEAQKPYGLNGFGSGRMPAFGATLSMDDLELLALYLRTGNMDGKG